MTAASERFALHDVSPTTVIVACQGRLSWEDRETMADRVQEHLLSRPELVDVVVDLAAVGFVNSAGLGAIFQLNRRLRDRGGRLVFANASPAVSRLFHAVGLDRLASIEPDIPAALAKLERPADSVPAEEAAPPSAPPM